MTGLALTLRSVRYTAATSVPGVRRVQAFCTTSAGVCAIEEDATSVARHSSAAEFFKSLSFQRGGTIIADKIRAAEYRSLLTPPCTSKAIKRDVWLWLRGSWAR